MPNSGCLEGAYSAADFLAHHLAHVPARAWQAGALVSAQVDGHAVVRRNRTASERCSLERTVPEIFVQEIDPVRVPSAAPRFEFLLIPSGIEVAKASSVKCCKRVNKRSTKTEASSRVPWQYSDLMMCIIDFDRITDRIQIKIELREHS